MNPIQQVYRQAKAWNDQLEEEALLQLKQTDAYTILPPDWDRIVVQQEQIEQRLGLPASRKTLRVATDALLDFALKWITQHGTAEQTARYRQALDTLLPFSSEPFLEVCMTLPENQDPSPIPSFMQELVAFFAQQAQGAEKALLQNYAVHESHLAFLERALIHIQRDQPEEAEAALLSFSYEEEPRRREQARLLAILGRQERSPHTERQEALLRQLAAALPTSSEPDGEGPA
jgi:hypothetical protein